MLPVKFREEPHCWVWSERLWCFYGTFAFYLAFVHGTPLTGNQRSRGKVWLSLPPTSSPPPPSSSRIPRRPAWSTNLASCPGSFDVDEWPHPTPTYNYLLSIKYLQICQLSPSFDPVAAIPMRWGAIYFGGFMLLWAAGLIHHPFHSSFKEEIKNYVLVCGPF